MWCVFKGKDHQETKPEMMQGLESADHDFEVATLTIFNNMKNTMLVMNENKENLSIENIKKNQVEILVLKYHVWDKNSLSRLNRRVEIIEAKVSEPEIRVREMIKTEREKEMKSNKQSLTDLQDNVRIF